MFPDLTKILKTADEQGKLSEVRHNEIIKRYDIIIQLMRENNDYLANILSQLESQADAQDVQHEAGKK